MAVLPTAKSPALHKQEEIDQAHSHTEGWKTRREKKEQWRKAAAA
jgi:hypothetical protein